MAESKAFKAGPRWTRWLLVFSLAMNFMVVGVVGGWMLKGGPHGHDHPSRLDKIGGPLTRALSPEDRKSIRKDMRAAYRARTGDRAQDKAVMGALIADLRRSPFDRDAVASHMAVQRKVLSERLALGQSLLLDRFAAMQEQERSAFADRLEQALSRRGKSRAD